MKSVPLNVIKELADMQLHALRTRYKRAVGLELRDGSAHYQSRGRLIVEILRYEFQAVELVANETKTECIAEGD